MNADARQSANVYNIRIFGCYGPTDAKTKFIRDAIDCCLEGRPITIRQDCMFDYMYVEDLAEIIKTMSGTALRYHDYNVCTGRRIALSEVAAEVARQMGNNRPIEIGKPGWNSEYTASNSRFMMEFPGFEFTSIEDGIARQIAWQKGC
jgi:GDP-L-fucose synthase